MKWPIVLGLLGVGVAWLVVCNRASAAVLPPPGPVQQPPQQLPQQPALPPEPGPNATSAEWEAYWEELTTGNYDGLARGVDQSLSYYGHGYAGGGTLGSR